MHDQIRDYIRAGFAGLYIVTFEDVHAQIIARIGTNNTWFNPNEADNGKTCGGGEQTGGMYEPMREQLEGN
jgi:hypothetical protein